MRTFIALCLVAVVAATIEEDFVSWAQGNHKYYGTKAEFDHRFSVWKSNLEFVNKWNSEAHTSRVGMNVMADLTNEEYRAIYLRPMSTEKPALVQEVPTVVPEVDWRTKGCVTEVKDQKQCGSCYSFAATAAMEWCHACKAGHGLTSLTEQQCVDCSLSCGNLACQGGWMENCWTCKCPNCTEAAYPYTAVRGTCKTCTAVANPTGTVSVSASETALQSAIQQAVVAVAIDASLSSFQLYSGGIYCPTGCSTTSLDHAVTAVGMSSSGGDHYIVKNSWGQSWGISGYIYMCANQSNHCGIATHARYPNCP
jgi:C1A family cysteine protease